MADRLVVRGAREHNLRSVDLDLPRDSLIVFTGLSGSGKSSLAFDTIFAEGQRRYVESLSAYARQFLGQMDKPDVDFIEGLSPAVSIDQKSTSRNPRSTVGTITEVYDYLRLLYARAGEPHCPTCGERISRQTPQQIVDQHPGVALGLQLGEQVDELALAGAHHRGEHLEPDALVQIEDLVDDLLRGLPGDALAAGRAVRLTGAGVEQAQVVVHLGDGADRGPRVAAGGLLVDGDRGREALDEVDVGLVHLPEELPGVRRERLHVPALALGEDGVEREARLARPGQPGEHDKAVPGQVEVDAAQVVLARATDDEAVGHTIPSDLVVRCPRRC